MNRKLSILLLLIFVILIFGNAIFVEVKHQISVGEKHSLKNIALAKEYILSVIKNNKAKRDFGSLSYSWNIENSHNNFKYYNAFVMYALLKTNSDDIPKLFYNDIITQSGDIDSGTNKNNIPKEGELDTIFVYYPLYYLPKEKKYSLATDKAYKNLSNQGTLPNCGDNFIHKINNANWKTYPFGLDGIFMALPFYARYSRDYDEVLKRISWVSDNMILSNGLYAHGADSYGNTNGIVWLRGAGWYGLAQIELLESIENENYKKIISNQLKKFLDGMLKYQDYKTGMWQNVIYPKTYRCNKFESSGTLMMAYILLTAYTNNYVKDKKYLNAGIRAFNGVIDYNLKSKGGLEHLNNIYLSSNVKSEPSEYCVCEKYVSDEAKGFAPLILAVDAAEKVFKMK